MSKELTLGYLGYKFQIELINQILHPANKKFADRIIGIVHTKYFDNEYFRLIVATIKDYYERYEKIPAWDTLETILKVEIKDKITQDYIFEITKEIRDLDVEDWEYVQEEALNFCRQQELIKATDKISKIIDNGEFGRYEECAEIMKEALSVGAEKDDGTSICDGWDTVLKENFRDPINTGIKGIDELTKGGLSRGELGVVLAPYGVGKSTILTKIANTAYNLGFNVLQIIFEDLPDVIKRKHAACWSGIELNELSSNEEEVFNVIKEKTQGRTNDLIIRKFSSEGVTMNHIKTYVRHLISTGFKPDMIVLDYIDCVESTKKYNDEWSGEGNVMRGFETLIYEHQMVGWTAVQGNRCLSLDTEVTILNKGKIQIKDVVEGDEILTHLGYKKIITKFPIEKQGVYKITTKSGKVIKVSAKHEFPVKYGKLKSISTGLGVGDKLFVKK
jgi:replicative DNA helicase